MDILDGGVDILITNLNKLNRMIDTDKIDISKTQYIVADESDVFVENLKKDFQRVLDKFQRK